jgi:hypothetical protein
VCWGLTSSLSWAAPSQRGTPEPWRESGDGQRATGRQAGTLLVLVLRPLHDLEHPCGNTLMPLCAVSAIAGTVKADMRAHERVRVQVRVPEPAPEQRQSSARTNAGRPPDRPPDRHAAMLVSNA